MGTRRTGSDADFGGRDTAASARVRSVYHTGRRAVLAGIAGVALGTTGTTAGEKPKDESDDPTVRVKVTDGVDDAERCRLPRTTLVATGVEPGQQVRLYSDGDPALFTVDVAEGKFGALGPGGRDRLGATGGSFRLEADPTVVQPTWTSRRPPRRAGSSNAGAARRRRRWSRWHPTAGTSSTARTRRPAASGRRPGTGPVVVGRRIRPLARHVYGAPGGRPGRRGTRSTG